MNKITSYYGEACSVLETEIPHKSISLLLTDPPYAYDPKKQYTANEWDKPIDWNRWWTAAWKVMKPNGAILIFGNPPFSFELLANPLARKYYRYDWIWKKERGSNFQLANKQPMKIHEHIHVFYRKQPNYIPIKTELDKVTQVKSTIRRKKTEGLVESSASTIHPGGIYVGKFPTSILTFSRDRPMIHATQKPVGLLEYLIRTYTIPTDTILDTFAGYSSTGVAVQNIGERDYIGIELDKGWYEKGVERLTNNTQKVGCNESGIRINI